MCHAFLKSATPLAAFFMILIHFFSGSLLPGLPGATITKARTTGIACIEQPAGQRYEAFSSANSFVFRLLVLHGRIRQMRPTYGRLIAKCPICKPLHAHDNQGTGAQRSLTVFG